MAHFLGKLLLTAAAAATGAAVYHMYAKKDDPRVKQMKKDVSDLGQHAAQTVKTYVPLGKELAKEAAGNLKDAVQKTAKTMGDSLKPKAEEAAPANEEQDFAQKAQEAMEELENTQEEASQAEEALPPQDFHKVEDIQNPQEAPAFTPLAQAAQTPDQVEDFFDEEDEVLEDAPQIDIQG